MFNFRVLRPFYHQDLTNGDAFPTKPCSKLEPKPYSIDLYDKEGTCYVVVAYCVDRDLTTYFATYKYLDVDPVRLKELVNDTFENEE